MRQLYSFLTRNSLGPDLKTMKPVMLTISSCLSLTFGATALTNQIHYMDLSRLRHQYGIFRVQSRTFFE